MADFNVSRGSAVIASGSATLTLTEGVDFSVTGSDWFARITNSNHTGMGRTSGGGNQNADDFTVSLSYSGDDVVFTRYGTSQNCRVDWEVIEYIGASGGPNEIKVRERGTRSIASGSETDSFALPGPVVSSGDVIPFITGQRTSYTGRNNVNRGLFTADISGGNIVLDRGSSGNTATVSYAVVEFTGSNWTITKQFTDRAQTTNETVNLTTPLADFARAWLHSTYLYRSNSTVGLDDASERVRLVSNTQINFWSAVSGNRLGEHIVWIAENPDQTVNEYTGTMAGAGEEEVDTFSITPVADLAQSSVMITNDSTGSGTAMPRGYINVTLQDASTVLLRQSDNGQTSDYSVLVVEWPQDVGGGGPADIVGSFGVQETGEDTKSALGAVAVEGNGATQEFGADTALATGAITDPGRVAVLAAQEAGLDQLASIGGVFVAASFVGAESGQDALSSSGLVSATGNLSAAELGQDVSSASGAVSDPDLAGNLAAQETGSDQATAAGSVQSEAALAAVETGQDTFSASGTITALGRVAVLSAQEAGEDALHGLGQVIATGSLIATETGEDGASASGTIQVAGGLVGTETGSDELSAAATLETSGQAAVREGATDDLAGTGSVSIAATFLAEEQGQDGVDAAIQVNISTLLSGVEAGSDQFDATGAISAATITGILLAKEINSVTVIETDEVLEFTVPTVEPPSPTTLTRSTPTASRNQPVLTPPNRTLT